MRYQYELHPRFAKHRNMFHLVNGKTVNLTGRKYKHTKPGGKNSVAVEVEVPGATQADLKWVYEQEGNTLVVRKETVKPEKKQIDGE